MKTFWVYIMSDKSRRLYTGLTSILIKHVFQHKNKLYPDSFTALYPPAAIEEHVKNTNFIIDKQVNLSYGMDRMKQYTTREAARKLGLNVKSIQRYIAAGKISAPPVQNLGGGKFRVWTEAEIEHVRQLLPKIANGRKTRYKKKGTKPPNKKK